MRVFTKWMLTLMLLVVCIGANAEKKYLTFKCEDYCAAKWNAETNTLSWGSGGWNTAWTFMAANYEDGTAVSGDLSEWELLHLNAKNFTNASAKELTVVFKKNDGSNPPSGPTREFVVSPDENGDITIDLTNVEWGNCDITNIQDLTIYGCARDDNSVDASVVVTDAYLAKGESEAPLGEPILILKGTVGDEVSIKPGVYDEFDVFSVDFGDGVLVTDSVGHQNKGICVNDGTETWPQKEGTTHTGITEFKGVVAGDGTIKVYGKSDIWYLAITGAAPETVDQPKLKKVVQFTISKVALDALDLKGLDDLKIFGFSQGSLKTINVKDNAALTKLTINNNSASLFESVLETLDVSGNANLEELNVMGASAAKPGKLKALDLSANTKLKNLYAQYNAITNVILPEGAALAFANLQDNQIESIDLTKVASFKDTYLNNNKLKTVDLSKLTAGANLYLDGNELTEVTVPVSVKNLQLNGNKLTKLSIVEATASCKLENNMLTLATIPAQPKAMNSKSKTGKFTYAPQAALEVEETVSELDLSAQLTVAKGELDPAADEDAGIAAYSRWLENGTTTYSFVTTSGTALVEGTDYEVTEPGKFRFLKDQEEKVYAVMLNTALPKFTEAVPFKTTEFTVIEYVEPTDLVKLEHTASSYCGDDPEVYTSDVDAETEHVNNAAFNAKWQGAAYAEFSFSKLPANATITNAVLTFKGIGESRNPRNADVMLVNAGETLDYAAMAAGNAKVNLDATKIQSVTFPKGTSEVFTVDVTEQLGALVAGGQKYAIFKVTGNPGGGDIAGKASADAPTLVITFAPGAPEIANASFDANPADVITVTTQGYQRNIPDGSDQITGLQPVTGWTAGTQTESDPGYVGGVFAYGSENLLNNKVAAPATAPEGSESPSALGLAAVWGGYAHYTQSVTAPAGDYKLSYTVYNGANTGAVTKNLFGFVADNGTEYLSDVKSFTVGEWATYDVTFTLAEETTGKISVGFIGSGGSGNAPHLFVDNVKLEKVAGVEVALKELETAIAEAQAKADTYTVGDGLFMYAASEIEPLTAAIATAQAAYTAAESKEAVATASETLNAFIAAFAPVATLPDADKAYTFELRLGGETPLYMALAEGGITIAEEATPLKFIAVEGAAGQYNLSNEEGTLFVGLAGGDAWTMSTTAENKAAWTFTAIPDGAYRINNLVTAGRFVGTNAADKEAGKPCYADKRTDNGNVDWIIAVSEAGPEVNPDEPESAVADGWVSVISNGNLAGDEVVNFFTKENSGDPIPAVITPGAGKDNSRGIVINTPDAPSTDWDAQFFIQANENIPAGRKIHVEFDYMATQEAGFDTQSHAAPGDYIWWFCVGSETANTEWKHFSAEVEVSAGKLNDNGGIDGEYGKACDGSEGGKPFQTVAFNLSKVETATTFHFDNIVFWVSDVDVSVKDVKGTNTDSGAIYDLQGRRVATPAKGLYIVNGKKIMVK